MSDYFSLGSVTLSWTPETLTYKPGAKVTQHELIGGARVFDILGPNPAPIQIGGKLAGPTRFTERDELTAMLGTSQLLIVGTDATQVVVLDVSIDQAWGYLTYSISCAVQNPVTTTSTPTAQQAVTADTNNANAATSSTAYPTVSTPLTAASTSLTSGSSASTVLTQLQTAQTASSGLLAATDTVLAANGSVGTTATTAFQAIAGLQALSTAYTTYATLSPVSSLIGGAINTIEGV